MPDGSAVQGIFPNRDTQRPRLLYHRHFMLSENLNNFFIPPDAPEPAPAEIAALFEAHVKSYAKHLMHVYGAEQISLELVRHDLPDPELIKRGVRLDDERSYRTLYSGTFKKDEV